MSGCPNDKTAEVYSEMHSSSAIMISGSPPEEIFAACSSVSFPPAEAAQASNAVIEGKWISAIR
jgi:hypothetical protein